MTIPFVMDHTGQIKGLITWRDSHLEEYPDLKLLHFHPTLGTRKNIYIPVLLWQQGFRRGTPELFLPLRRCGYSGMYIISSARKDRWQGDCWEFREGVEAQGFYWHVMKTWLQTKDMLVAYYRDDDSFVHHELPREKFFHEEQQFEER